MTALAGALGLSEDKVAAALEAVRPGRRARRRHPARRRHAAERRRHDAARRHRRRHDDRDGAVVSPQEHARARLAERARAVARIRRGVVAAALAAFALAWGVIAATGRWAPRPPRRRPTSTGSTATTTGSTGDDSSSSSVDDGAAASGARHDRPVLTWTPSTSSGSRAAPRASSLLLASSAAVTAGLLMGAGTARGRTAQLRVAHEALSLATMAALVVHAGRAARRRLPRARASPTSRSRS